MIERKEPLGTWRHLLGDVFGFAQPHLVPCAGEHARNIVCPETGHILAVRQVKERRVAYPAEDFEADAEEVRELRDEDVQVWQIDRDSVITALRGTLGIATTQAWHADGCSLVGTCRRCGGGRTAYVSWARDGEQALTHVERVAGHSRRGGCMLVPQRYRGVGDALGRAGFAEVSLAEAFSIVEDRLTGDCDRACEDIDRDLPVRGLKEHLDGRLDTLGHEYADLKRENQELKQNLAQVLSNLAQRVDPEFFRAVFAVLGTGSVSKAAKTMGIPNSTLDGQLRAFARRGGLYRTLYDSFAVRRKLGVRRVERFNDLFGGHQPSELSDADLLGELLDGLEALSEDNWQAVRDELITLVRTAMT